MPGRDGVEEHLVTCPVCGESLRLLVETDVAGEMVQDCEVCCHPWRVTITEGGGERRVEVAALDA